MGTFTNGRLFEAKESNQRPELPCNSWQRNTNKSKLIDKTRKSEKANYYDTPTRLSLSVSGFSLGQSLESLSVFDFRLFKERFEHCESVLNHSHRRVIVSAHRKAQNRQSFSRKSAAFYLRFNRNALSNPRILNFAVNGSRWIIGLDPELEANDVDCSIVISIGDIFYNLSSQRLAPRNKRREEATGIDYGAQETFWILSDCCSGQFVCGIVEHSCETINQFLIDGVVSIVSHHNAGLCRGEER